MLELLVPKSIPKEAERRNFFALDATCPLVTKVQRLAQKLVRQGYYLVVYGDSYHPEVKSVLGWANTSKSCSAKKVADLPWNTRRGKEGPGLIAPPRKVAVVSQTTKNIDELMKFAAEQQAMVVQHRFLQSRGVGVPPAHGHFDRLCPLGKS